ncbi:MAG TPA: protein kinase [Thermoanaerobaculia bacterium]|nr:protein kinase [Thermoanaerobaculia bacterium]
MLVPDQHLGPYRLIARVGAGGMGEVWRAEDTRLGRTVAIKVLPPSVLADVEATARLKREARTAAQLYHPSIATIHSIEQDGDHIFIVEEFVEGESLTQVIKRGGLSESEVCRIARAVADALAEAHAKGIVHRDIKPDNIIVSGNRVKVLDFGIAKQVGVAGAPSSETPTAFVTQQGMILGTIHYMSPEQALGKTIEGRTDVFSLGVVLYEMATGRRPFGGETITETMTQIIRDEPAEPLSVNPGISPGMNEIIRRCLRKNVAERFTAAELVTALDAQLGRAKTAPYTNANALTAATPTLLTGSQLKTVQESSTQPRRRSALPVVIIVLVIALAAAAAVIATHRSAPAPATQTTAPAPQPVAPSTTSVSVTAPPAVIEEQKPVVPEVKPVTTHTAETAQARPPTITTQETPPAPAPAPAPVPQPALEPRAEALYATAISQLAGGDWMEARKTLHRVLQQDPHFAKAHFRMGEIALLNRNLVPAREQLNLALTDSDRLDRREQQLTRIGLALADRNRPEIQRLAEEIWQQWPGDPDLTRMRATFPGMFLELPRERFKPQRRRGH